MTCEELQDYHELHALGLLEGVERDEIDEHLARGCPNCTPRMRRAIGMNTGLLALAPDVQPPARLRRRVLQSVGLEQPRLGWILGWSSALAALLLVTLWLSAQERQRTNDLAQARTELQTSTREAQSSAAELARVQEALTLLNQPETRQVVFGGAQTQPPRGRVFVNANRGVLLLASNLPQVAPGKTYQLWVIPRGGAPQSAGLFQSDPSGNVLFRAARAVDLALTAAVAVSVEPAAGSTAPTTTPLIVAAL